MKKTPLILKNDRGSTLLVGVMILAVLIGFCNLKELISTLRMVSRFKLQSCAGNLRKHFLLVLIFVASQDSANSVFDNNLLNL